MKCGPMIAVLAWMVLLPAQAEEAKPDKPAFRAEAALAEARAALAEGKHDVATAKAEEAFSIGVADFVHAEARWIHGQAQHALGRAVHARASLRAALHKWESDAPLSAEALALYGQARTMLLGMKLGDAELDKAMRQQAARLATLAGKRLKADAYGAGQAAAAALQLDPSLEAAKAALETATAGLAGRAESLLDGSLSAWTFLSENWVAREGMLVGHVDKTAKIVRTNRKWSGEYDFVVEARCAKGFREHGAPSFSIAAPMFSPSLMFAFDVMEEEMSAREEAGPNSSKRHFTILSSAMPDKPKFSDWATYELRVRKGDIACVYDGKELCRHPRPAGLADGHLAIIVQIATVEFRRVEIVRR